MDLLDHELSTSREIMVHNYLHVFAVSCLFYDHFITFGEREFNQYMEEQGLTTLSPVPPLTGQEVNYLWLRPKTRSSYWFLLNRYFAFFGNIVVLVLGFMDLTSQTLLILNQVVVCILLTARIYAIYGCSIRILMFMTGVGLGLLAIACWQLFVQKGSPSETVGGCHIAFTKITSIRFAATWESIFVYDTLIFSLTIVKSWRMQQDHAITGINIPLISLILKDGAIYFVVMALCNLANILTFYLAGPFMRGGLSTFASAMSVCMMSRLMLNLHETADNGIYSTATTTMGQHPDETLDIVSPSAVSMESDTPTSIRRKSR